MGNKCPPQFLLLDNLTAYGARRPLAVVTFTLLKARMSLFLFLFLS
jgi:hypothetical protein